MTKVLIPIKTTGAEKSKKQIKGVGGSLTSLAKKAGIAAGAYLAARGLVNAVGASVTAFAEQETAEKRNSFKINWTCGWNDSRTIKTHGQIFIRTN